MSTVRAPERLFVLLGDPVHHSLSPAMHNAAFRALGLDAVYVALRTWDELVGPLMRSVAGGGGGGNVTLPHKGRAATALDHASEAVRATGACNVFWWEQERGLCGDNTDVEAFRRAAEAVLGGPLEGRRVLLLGAGGAARAVAYACIQARAAGVEILNRSTDRARAMIRDLGAPPGLRLVEEPAVVRSEAFDLIVNATSLGLSRQDPLPLDPGAVSVRAVLDLVYSPEETRFVDAARRVGVAAADGRGMLVEQAVASFRHWFGREPPREVMLRAVGLAE